MTTTAPSPGPAVTRPPYATRTWVEQIMGMPISVTIRATDTSRPDILEVVETAWTIFRETDLVFSTWRNDSDLMQIRRGLLSEGAAHPWIGDVKALCAYAEAVTGDLFTTELTAPDGSVGWDPTGLVKGWSADRVGARLRAVPEITFCINAGGDVLCGVGQDAESLVAPWRVGLQDPGDRTAVRGVIEIVDGALATSGVSARGLHIVDPRTDKPAREVTQVTVRGPKLTWADVWATACFIEPTTRPYDDYIVVDIVQR